MNRDLLCKGGSAQLGFWPSLRWAQHLQSGTSPLPLLRGPARDPICLLWRPLALDGLGDGDIQGWATNGQQ